MPLWLTFQSSDPTCSESIITIFKDGDDVRQDTLCLQVSRAEPLRAPSKGWRAIPCDIRREGGQPLVMLKGRVTCGTIRCAKSLDAFVSMFGDPGCWGTRLFLQPL